MRYKCQVTCFQPAIGHTFHSNFADYLEGTSSSIRRMSDEKTVQDKPSATVEDVQESTNVSVNVSTTQNLSGAEAASPFANLGPNPFSGSPSSNSFDPFAVFAGNIDASGKATVPCSEQEGIDMEKLAQFFAQTSDIKETAEVMKNFQIAHPNMKPDVFMAHFPMKMNPLIESLPAEEKFPKLMLMLNAFASIDPMIGKVMEGLVPMMNDAPDLFRDLDSSHIPDNEAGQDAGIPDFLMTNGPFNEGLDELSLEELDQMGLGEFSNMPFEDLMNFAQNFGYNEHGVVPNQNAGNAATDQQPKQSK